MSNLKMYCVTNKKLKFLENTKLILAGVGKEKFSNKYLRCDTRDNIFHKEKHYSELTFHYWYWKNLLQDEKNYWVGFCQKRRFWLKNIKIKNKSKINQNNINDFILREVPNKFKSFESFICKPIKVSGAKKIKIIKKGWRNLIKDPQLLIYPETISFHFDMHHGYKNLEKAIRLLDQNDEDDFRNYVNTKNLFNPHIMCIARPHILEKWFSELFSWLNRCETEFGFKNLEGYRTQRLYAYLAERYLSYWFKKYTKYKELPWITLQDV